MSSSLPSAVAAPAERAADGQAARGESAGRCLLRDSSGRWVPESRDRDEETAAEPWVYAGERDMFPEELIRCRGSLGQDRKA